MRHNRLNPTLILTSPSRSLVTEHAIPRPMVTVHHLLMMLMHLPRTRWMLLLRCHIMIMNPLRMLHPAPDARDHPSLRLLRIHVRVHPELLRDELFERRAVPPILDVVLAAGGVEYLDGDLDPSLSEVLVPAPETQVVLAGEGEVVDGRVQVVDPSIAYLLAGATRELGGEVGPLGEGRVLIAVASVAVHAAASAAAIAGENDAEDDGVLLLPPLSLARSGLEVPRPSIVAFPRRTSHAVLLT